jgi:ABC-type amino acid transport system permease subunit
MMYDFSFGGVYDDAFSGTILIHIWKSVQRVYGGFFLAALIGIPLGMMIGRIKILRQLLDPTISLLRPIPVTAWLPLSMIFFGLGPNAAIFLVFLGAFYPIWRALGRSATVRGGFHAWLFRHGDVSRNHTSGFAAGHLQRSADRAWIRLDPHRGR